MPSEPAPFTVLMTADTIGGVWTYALTLARAMDRFDVQVELATMGAPLSDDQRASVETLENVRVHESTYKLEWMEDPWQEVATAGEWLLDLESDIAPDLIHLNGYAHGSLGWDAPVLMVGHSCVYSWFEAVHGERPPTRWERYRRAVTAGLQQADCVTAPSEAMLNALDEHYGSFRRSTAIYNASSQDRFVPLEKAPFILSAGRLWDKAKNMEALERVAPHLDWPIKIAGDCHHPDGGCIRFDGISLLGQLAPDEMAEYAGAASIYALPARYEPFGLSALEAGMAGCVLVLGDIPSLREVWGEAAQYVPPDDSGALRTTLQNLIEDDDLRRTMAQRARKHAVTFTPQRMARRYRDLYQQILHPQPAIT